MSLVTILTSVLVGTNLVRPNTELVTEVTDGDTFFIQNGQAIRVYGLDSPESIVPSVIKQPLQDI